MDWSQALKALEKGKKVRRYWGGYSDKAYIELLEWGVFKEKFFYITEEQNSTQIYCLSYTDLCSKDWVEVA